MTTEDRAAQIRANLRADMHTTLVANGMVDFDEPVFNYLVDDAMFVIEHLLVEIEALVQHARNHGSLT